MNFDEYERERYAEFAETVADILGAAIKADPTYRLQQLQSRGKDPASLKVKLEKLDPAASDAIEDVVKDLAGCRVVFYTNDDVRRFLESDMLQRNFVIDRRRTKVHHPVPDSATESLLFQSDNIVVQLDEQRSVLPEYVRFRGMRCEIQVQTTINHAWSEMEHDLYKLKPVVGFGQDLYGQIQTRFDKVMREHLMPAGYEFQKIVDDYRRLASGRALFDQGHLQMLAKCSDNNERYDLLERIKTYVLPNLDDPANSHRVMREALVACMDQARTTPQRPISTPWGDLPGQSSEDIAGLCADIVDELRYASLESIEPTLDTFCELYARAASDKERGRVLESVQRLAAYNLGAWNTVGPAVQEILVRRVREWDAETLDTLRAVALTALGQMLRSEANGTSATYKTITLSRAGLPPSEALEQVRARSMDILEDLFRSAQNDRERREVKQAMLEATRSPQRGGDASRLQATLLGNTRRIVHFFRDQVPTLSYELLQTLEHDVLWQYRYARPEAGAPAETQDVADARRVLNDTILGFRDFANGNRDFVIYKTLVGFESVLAPHWDGDPMDVQAERAYREAKVDELVREVNESNADDWLVILKRCANTNSNDLATFPTFGRFLEALARSQPGIVEAYIDRLDDHLANFLPSLLQGLAATEHWPAIKTRIDRWVSERRYLRQILWHQRFATSVDVGLVEAVLPLAIEEGDDRAVLAAAEVCAARSDSFPSEQLGALFTRIVEQCQAKGSTAWVEVVWPDVPNGSLIPSLSATQIDVILAALVSREKVDHHVECVLVAIAKRFPEKIIDFMRDRMNWDESDSDADRYEPIPYHMGTLGKHLLPAGGYLITQSQLWHQQKPALFEFHGGKLLSLVFPEFTPDLEALLAPVLASGNESAANYVASMLHCYKGAPATHELYKRIVDAAPEDAEVLSAVDAGVIYSIGLTSGEFGRRQALQRRKSALAPWLADPRSRVKAYASARDRTLEGMIATEQRQSEQELEARKRHYGEDGDDTSPVG